MMRLKLMTVVGTRREIVKLSETIKLCDEVFEQILVHAGRNYDHELNQAFFEVFGLREPDCYLDVAGADLGETMGNVLSKSYSLMAEICPEALLLLDDANSCLSVIFANVSRSPFFTWRLATAASMRTCPKRSTVGSSTRRATRDVNLCYSEHARRILVAMGCDPACALVAGSPITRSARSELQSH